MQRRHSKSANLARQGGFTMIELAVVILIMGLVLGGLAMPLATQRDNARLRDARAQAEAVVAALHGYAMVNGSLPCPATPASAGQAAALPGACVTQHGFVPSTTLNISGSRNADTLLLDPWGSPLRYSVSATDADGDGQWDFTTPGELADVTIPLLSPDLVICSTSAGATATACGTPGTTLSAAAPIVVYSLGKDWSGFTSADQVENVGATIAGGVSGASYRIAANTVFVSRTRSEQPGAEYDDVVIWLSDNTLYHGLVTAGRLP